MKIFISAIIFASGLLLLHSCALTDNRESIVHEYLQQKVSNESEDILILDNFKKTNGYEKEIAGMKIYILEWTAEVTTQQEIWKGGDAMLGYWKTFGVMTRKPSRLDIFEGVSPKHFGSGASFRLTGESRLKKTEQGWRVEESHVKTSQILNSGIITDNSNAPGIGNPAADKNSNPSSGNTGSVPSNSNSGKFQGAWFEVWVPSNFKVIPSLKSETSTEGYESAFFRSPDNKVEFYIFSPQWSGEPTDIAINTSTEKQVELTSRTSEDNIVTWYSIKANNGSYTRAYQDTKATDGSTRKVVGIKYSDQNAYDSYKADYLKFKNSLQQFAD